MNARLLFVTLLFLAFVCNSEGLFGIRFRRLLRKGCQVECPRLCPKKILFITVDCDVFCMTLCGKSKRRAIESEYHVSPLPISPDFYDINEDGLIDISEMARSLGQTVTQGLQKAFNLTDTNGDSVLTLEEFRTSKVLVFERMDEL